MIILHVILLQEDAQFFNMIIVIDVKGRPLKSFWQVQWLLPHFVLLEMRDRPLLRILFSWLDNCLRKPVFVLAEQVCQMFETGSPQKMDILIIRDVQELLDCILDIKVWSISVNLQLLKGDTQIVDGFLLLHSLLIPFLFLLLLVLVACPITLIPLLLIPLFLLRCLRWL